MARLRIAVLLSGRGSNMLAIDDACRDGRLHGEIVLVASDRADAAGIAAAQGRGLPAISLPLAGFADRSAQEAGMQAAVLAAAPDCIALAGYMRILSAEFVESFVGRMLNIHPSLLPKYKGLHTHRRALEAGDAWHGASVHFVTPELDGGPVVLQARVPVRPGDDESALSARVQTCEHIIYPRVLQWMATGRLVYRDGPVLDGIALHTPRLEDCLESTAVDG